MSASKLIGTDAQNKAPDKAWLLCLLVAVFFGMVTAVAGGLTAVILLLALVVAGFTLTNYRVGLWFLVLLLPLSATTMFPREIFGITGANPYNVLFALTLLSLLIERLWKQKAGWNAAYPRFWWAFLLPVTVAALVGTFHYSEIPALAYAKELIHFTSPVGYLRDVLIKPLTYVLLAILLGTAGRDGMKPNAVMAALCLSMWLLAAWIFAYVLLSGIGLGQLANATSRDSLSGSGMHANDLGPVAACVLTVMVFAMANTDKSGRWLYITTAGVCGALLLISFSRGAFLAFAVGLTVFFIVQRRLKIIIFALLILLLMLPLLPTELFERLSTGFGTGASQVLYRSDDPLTAGRVAGVWMPLFEEVRSNPLFGNGLLAVAWSVPFRSGALGLVTLNPHNLYLKLLLEVGVVGLVLIVLFFADLWRRFKTAANNPTTPPNLTGLFMGAAAALLGYAAFGLSGGDYLPDPSNSVLWVLWGLLLATPAERLSKGAYRAPLSPAAVAHPRRSAI